VDTSYTKFNRKPDPIDDNAFDKVVPPADLLYVGWKSVRRKTGVRRSD
jgi:hypothetical protein